MSDTQVGRKIPAQRFVGGCLGDVGYIAKRPGHGAMTDKLLESYNKARNYELREKDEQKNREKVAFMNDCWQKFDRIMVRSSISQVVQLGLDQAKRDLAHKRNKLKGVLLDEQTELSTEYTRKALEGMDKRMDAAKSKAKAIMQRSDDSERRRAQEIYAKMDMENSDEYKRKVRMEMMKIDHEVNKDIMRLKHLQKLSENDHQQYWIAENRIDENRRFKERECNEIEEAYLKNGKETQRQIFKMQMKEQKRIQKNMECVESLEEHNRKVVQDEQYRQLDLRDEEARQREARGFQALMKQIAENKALANKYQQQELFIDKIMQDDNRKKIEREQAAAEDNRMQEWRELVIFRQSMIDYRKASQMEDERIIEDHSKKIELEKYMARKAKENFKKGFAIDCFETCKQLASENVARKAAAKQKESNIGELAGHYTDVNSRLSSAYSKQKFMEQNPKPFNDEGLKYLKVLQERQRQEDREMLENMRKRDDERQKHMMLVLQQPLQEICKHQHPMYRILKSRDSH